MSKNNEWFVYILRCADETLYTGITTDVERRLIEHNAEKTVTKYTRARQPVKMVYQESIDSRSHALQREAQIKSFAKHQKESLIKDNQT